MVGEGVLFFFFEAAFFLFLVGAGLGYDGGGFFICSLFKSFVYFIILVLIFLLSFLNSILLITKHRNMTTSLIRPKMLLQILENIHLPRPQLLIHLNPPLQHHLLLSLLHLRITHSTLFLLLLLHLHRLAHVLLLHLIHLAEEVNVGLVFFVGGVLFVVDGGADLLGDLVGGFEVLVVGGVVVVHEDVVFEVLVGVGVEGAAGYFDFD